MICGGLLDVGFKQKLHDPHNLREICSRLPSNVVLQINQLRQRVGDYMGKTKRSGSVKVPGHVGVGAVAGTFKA